MGLVKCSVKMLILSALSVEDCFWLVMSLDVFQRWKLKLVKAVAHNLNSNDSLEGYPDLDTPNCENALGWMLFFQTTRSKHKLIDSLTVSKQPWKTLRKSGWAKNLEDRHGRLHVFSAPFPKQVPSNLGVTKLTKPLNLIPTLRVHFLEGACGGLFYRNRPLLPVGSCFFGRKLGSLASNLWIFRPWLLSSQNI